MNKKSTILDWVDQYPETEALIREYDSKVGCCILCQCLFDTIEEIESAYKVDLDELFNRLQALVELRNQFSS